MATSVTKENNDSVMEFFHITEKNRDKSRVKVRRNGRTKYWKTRPNDFRIPVKYGMYTYLYIDQNNCEQWTID